jgi:hypothetical protein
LGNQSHIEELLDPLGRMIDAPSQSFYNITFVTVQNCVDLFWLELCYASLTIFGAPFHKETTTVRVQLKVFHSQTMQLAPSLDGKAKHTKVIHPIEQTARVGLTHAHIDQDLVLGFLCYHLHPIRQMPKT